MIMKENHNATLCDSESHGKETKPLAFGVKAVYQLDDSCKGADEVSKSEIVVPISNDDGSGRVGSVTNEAPGELSHGSGQERDGGNESSETKDGEKLHSSPSLSSAGDSGSLPISKLDSLETDKNQCFVKCQLPESIVCDKKINDQSVKDICMDEGMPAKDGKLTGSCKDDQSGISSSRIPSDNFHCSGEEGVDNELIAFNAKRFGENDCGNVGVNEEKVPIQSIPDRSFDRDSSQNCETENSMQTDDAICATSGMIDADKESFANSKLPVQELGTRRSLMSLFNSLDGEEGKFVQPLGQISAGNEVSESPASLPAEVEPITNNRQEDILSNSNSDERGGSSSFSCPAPGGTSIANEQIKNELEQPLESRDVSIHHIDGNSPNTGAVEEQSLHRENVDSDHSSRTKTTLVESSDQERSVKSNEPSESSEVQTSASSKDQSSIIKEDQPIQPSVTKHERKNSNDASAVSSQLLYPEEVSNFPTAGLITYSGPIAYSGSLSLRSDGSAASGKSFAFPVLPSEWNSSPVRMAKADRRYYEKQKSWRSGIFCCRF